MSNRCLILLILANYSVLPKEIGALIHETDRKSVEPVVSGSAQQLRFAVALACILSSHRRYSHTNKPFAQSARGY